MKPLEDSQINEKSVGGDSDTEILNLENELYSLTHYADDVEELVSQMFSSIKGAKLQAMLPPILKEIPLIDVQQLCLHELRGMSSRRILSIINGVEMSDSSSEEEEDLLDLNLRTEADEKNSKECNPDSMEVESLRDLSLVDDPLLTALDVRQLEMRAKLIKNMLSKQPGEDSGEEEKEDFDLSNHDLNIKIKEEPLSSDEEARKKDNRSRKRRSSSYDSSRSSSTSSNSSYSSYSSRSTHSSDSDKQSQKSNQDDSPNTKKHKKKISKKEFEARMRKARMNRTYRKRKDSDDDSVKESRSRRRRKRKLEKEKKEPTLELMETSESKENGLVEENFPQKSTENEKQEEPSKNGHEDNMADDIIEKNDKEDPPVEGEVLEKEEGEIDSNEENYYSDSRSSSYSSRSYSSSPKRHRRHKRRSRRRKTRTPPIPKVPNWDPGSKSALPKKTGKAVDESKSLPLTPLTEDRQSVSFTLSKKSGCSAVVTLDTTPGENAPSTEILPLVKKVEVDAITTSELHDIPLKNKENLTEMVYEVSGSEEEDGALQYNSDADLQDDSVVDPIKSLEVDDASAPLEEESPDTSEAQEDVTTSEFLAEDTSQDAIEPDEEGDGAYEQENTEIIGVIDPMDDNASSAFNDVSNSSWSTRWLQSEKVQQVVSDSKMLSKMRKNIQAKGKTKVRKAPSTSVMPLAVADNKIKVSKVDLKASKRVIGGIAEDYENLFGIKVKAPQSLPAPKSQKPLPVATTVDTLPKIKSLASALLDSDDDDDSEDDELWSKIMKK